MFKYGDVVNISCKQGFTGEATLSKCINMNKWNDNRPVCRVVPCPDFNMTESIELPTKLTKFHLHDIAIFKCRSGYILSGNATLTCLADNSHPVGKWSSVQPICIDNTSSAFPAAAVGAGVGSATAIILIAVIIVVLVKRRRTLKHRPQKSTIYKETPFESTVSEEAELKGDLKKFSGENDRGIIVSVINDNTYYNKVEVEGHYNNEEDGEGYYSFTLDKQIPRSAVLMKEFYDYVENEREVGGKLELEFAKLKSGLQKPTHSALKPGNKLKNKYKNMYAFWQLCDECCKLNGVWRCVYSTLYHSCETSTGNQVDTSTTTTTTTTVRTTHQAVTTSNANSHGFKKPQTTTALAYKRNVSVENTASVTLPTGAAIAIGAGSVTIVVLVVLFVYKRRKQPHNDTRDFPNSTPGINNSIGHNVPQPTGNPIYFVNGANSRAVIIFPPSLSNVQQTEQDAPPPYSFANVQQLMDSVPQTMVTQ
ncbi:CSMD [Mytilus coruscus]|uniref:CSMD n=1 Tax=Mytilus coruscus TaxID=42192 RepID=A0A6J8AXT3_MYTCO|nr:CSMD [Mytilus coruscus]